MVFVFIDADWKYRLLSWTQTPDTKQLHISPADQIIIKALTISVIICPPKCNYDRKSPMDATISRFDPLWSWLTLKLAVAVPVTLKCNRKNAWRWFQHIRSFRRNKVVAFIQSLIDVAMNDRCEWNWSAISEGAMWVWTANEEKKHLWWKSKSMFLCLFMLLS